MLLQGTGYERNNQFTVWKFLDKLEILRYLGGLLLVCVWSASCRGILSKREVLREVWRRGLKKSSWKNLKGDSNGDMQESFESHREDLFLEAW